MMAKVAVIAGSKNDAKYVEKAVAYLERFGIDTDAAYLSAHRTPGLLKEHLNNLESEGTKVIIAMAGLAAHLPGVVASMMTIPVIGVPLPGGVADGLDAMLSIAQMPRGIPVACVAVGGAENAAILAAQIVAGSDERVAEALTDYRETLARGETP